MTKVKQNKKTPVGINIENQVNHQLLNILKGGISWGTQYILVGNSGPKSKLSNLKSE